MTSNVTWCENSKTVEDSYLFLAPGQDLDTMEESSEIKTEASPARTSWIRSSMAAGGKRLSKALGYITGEMKECGEGLKGMICDISHWQPPKRLSYSPPPPPRNMLWGFSADQLEISFRGPLLPWKQRVCWDINTHICNCSVRISDSCVRSCYSTEKFC